MLFHVSGDALTIQLKGLKTRCACQTIVGSIHWRIAIAQCLSTNDCLLLLILLLPLRTQHVTGPSQFTVCS